MLADSVWHTGVFDCRDFEQLTTGHLISNEENLR